MGLLSQGSPLNWEETKKYADHIRKHGIIQFLNIYNKVKDRQKDVLKWGDEVSTDRMNERMNGKGSKVELIWLTGWLPFTYKLTNHYGYFCDTLFFLCLYYNIIMA